MFTSPVVFETLVIDTKREFSLTEGPRGKAIRAICNTSASCLAEAPRRETYSGPIGPVLRKVEGKEHPEAGEAAIPLMTSRRGVQ